MSFEYLDVRKVVKCAEYKAALDEKSKKLKKNLIESCAANPVTANSFIFSENTNNQLTLNLPTYELTLLFKERLVVINDVPLLKFSACDSNDLDDDDKEIISFYLGKNELVYIGEFKRNPSYGYDTESLFMDILEPTLQALKSAKKISY
ncbi:hypothetical protein ACJJVG_09965 [Pseudocitrobacter faecalis]|uniref:hypothetical protein n=1 Tax=Pseudocitrobacter faecalis TaxID=1398493 RepID=UPI00389B2F89